MTIQEVKLAIQDGGRAKLLSIDSDSQEYLLTLDSNFVIDLVNLDDYYEYYFTSNYTSVFSPEYKEGDRFVNKHHEWHTVAGNMFIQFDPTITDPYRLEKQIFHITCPQILETDSFYKESLATYLLFHSFYNTATIAKCLEDSIVDYTVSNFYNRSYQHYFFFFKPDFTDFDLPIVEKLIKNKEMITKMAPMLWTNYYFIFYKSVLTIGGVPFDLGNGNVLDLDIVKPIDNF